MYAIARALGTLNSQAISTSSSTTSTSTSSSIPTSSSAQAISQREGFDKSVAPDAQVSGPP